MGSYPSFIWSRILWGREVVEKGMRWRIRNGEQVLVYQNDWIPRPVTFKRISPPSLHLETTVSELINEKQEWKEDMIRQYFLRVDADQIIKIPLPRQPKPDKLLWHYDKRGNYSVKSGYQLALKMKFPNKPSYSEDKQTHGIVYGTFRFQKKSKSSYGGQQTTCSQHERIFGKRKLRSYHGVRDAKRQVNLSFTHFLNVKLL